MYRSTSMPESSSTAYLYDFGFRGRDARAIRIAITATPAHALSTAIAIFVASAMGLIYAIGSNHNRSFRPGVESAQSIESTGWGGLPR